MRIHETLAPYKHLRRERRAVIETGRLIGDGGYARVIVINAFSVVKLTCCKQTRLLLDSLRGLGRTDYPAGLPAVMESWGAVGADADGMVFHGYVLERLYDPLAVGERLRGKRAGRAVVEALRPMCDTPFRHAGRDMETLREHLDDARERCVLGVRTVTQEHRALAEQLAGLRMPGGLESTFGYLADFLAKSQGELDLFRDDNIMVDMHGNPMLADPVAEQTCEDTGTAQPAAKSFALVVHAVRRIEGLEAVTSWDTVAVCENQEALLAHPVESSTRGVGMVLESKVVVSSGTAHRALIGTPASRRSVWSLPGYGTSASTCR